ncbi:MAG: sel1 repeat family protein [Dehalococcoidia bacterium]|nr:sel1 repeat family protein [Dehalococcoidia bacterium]
MAKKKTTKKKVTRKKAPKKSPKKITASTLSAKLEKTIKKDFLICEETLRPDADRYSFLEENCKRIKSWQEAAEAGDARGQVLYGHCFIWGHGVEKDPKIAFEWFTKAAEQRNAAGQVSLGLCCEYGWGVNQNQNLANDWFEKAAEQGHQYAIDNLPIALRVRLGYEPHRVLTKEMMLGRLAELSEFTSITVEAATLGPRDDQSSRRADDANLDGLCTLSIEVARELVKHQTNLSLTGLVTIADDVAKVLSTHQGEGLHLNGLRSLTDAAVDSLKDFKGDDGYRTGLELGGLTSLSDMSARSFSKHRGRLDLSGLTVLSDAAAKGLSKHKGTMELNGLTTLSAVAAKHLAKHDGDLELYGLNDLSDEAAVEFANKDSVKTQTLVDAQIKKALKTLTATSASLSPSQRKKIKKLINEGHLPTAFELLKAADAEEGDWLAVFPKTKLKALVDTWDTETWEILVTELQSRPKVYELLKAAISKRINYSGSDSLVYHRFANSLQPIINGCSNDLKSLIDTLLTSRGMRSSVGLPRLR